MASLRPKVNPNTKLLRIAAYIGVIGSSSVLALKWFTDRRVRRSDYYLKATSQLLAYQPTVDLFGPPIYFGNIDFSDKRNINTRSEVRVLIPVVGSKNRGVLYTKAVRELDIDADVLISTGDPSEGSTFSPWRLEQIEVTVDNRPGEIARIPIVPFVIGKNELTSTNNVISSTT